MSTVMRIPLCAILQLQSKLDFGKMRLRKVRGMHGKGRQVVDDEAEKPYDPLDSSAVAGMSAHPCPGSL